MSGLFFLLFCIRSRPQLIVSHMRLIPPQVPSSLNKSVLYVVGRLNGKGAPEKDD